MSRLSDLDAAVVPRLARALRAVIDAVSSRRDAFWRRLLRRDLDRAAASARADEAAVAAVLARPGDRPARRRRDGVRLPPEVPGVPQSPAEGR